MLVSLSDSQDCNFAVVERTPVRLVSVAHSESSIVSQREDHCTRVTSQKRIGRTSDSRWLSLGVSGLTVVTTLYGESYHPVNSLDY